MPVQRRAREAFGDSIHTLKAFIDEQAPQVAAAAELVAGTFKGGHKVLIFGNGGSAADAQHIAAEFVNRFRVERPPLPALALTTDTSILTSVGNDYGFNQVFVKQIRALGRPGDVAWGISTSGDSPNVVEACKMARHLGLKVLALTGREGGVLATLADLALIVRTTETPRIQEVHITVGHVICDLVDYLLFPEKFTPA